MQVSFEFRAGEYYGMMLLMLAVVSVVSVQLWGKRLIGTCEGTTVDAVLFAGLTSPEPKGRRFL